MARRKPRRKSDLPDEIHDPKLGTLKFVCALDETDEYSGLTKVGGRKIEIRLYTDKEGRLNPTIKKAQRLVERYPAIKMKIDRYVERKIFPEYNNIFRPGKKSFTLDQLLRKLKLESIGVYPVPPCTIWFDPGDAFAWHGLQIFLGARNAVVDHDMPG